MKKLYLPGCLFLFFSALSGCGDVPSVPISTTVQSDSPDGWPRTIETIKGPITLKKPPERIISTSVTLTGTLLTVNAPLVASSATKHMTSVTDETGFFTQWSTLAQSRQVKALYQGEVNTEAVLAENPDLIVVSATGGDSALKAYEQLSQIAPTLVINYDDKSWEDLALLLGKATGHEADASRAIASFDAHLQTVKQRIRLPQQPVSAMAYYEDNSGANIWTTDSAQGRLLARLGFSLAALPAQVAGQTETLGRKDIVPVSGERFQQSLTGKTLMLFSADEKTAASVRQNHFLAQHPAIQSGRVYPLGIDTFRLDYYSATNLLHRLDQLFSVSAANAGGTVEQTGS